MSTLTCAVVVKLHHGRTVSFRQSLTDLFRLLVPAESTVGDPELTKFFFFNVYLFLREREERKSTSRGGAEREGDTESEAAPGSELSEPDAGLELVTCEILTGAEVGCSTD